MLSLDADVILLNNWWSDGAKSDAELLKTLDELPLWNELKAVKNKQVLMPLAEYTNLPAASSAAPPARRTKSASVSRVSLIVLVLLVALAVLLVLSLILGVTPIPPDQVLRILFTGEGEKVPRLVITTQRLLRAVLGALIGASMALTGVMLQDSLKNVLADPGLLGVSTGASLVVAVIVVFDVPVPFGTLPIFALLGGLVSGLIILFTTRLTRDPVRTILVGAALAALMGALITTVIVLAKPNDLRMVLPWRALGIPVSLLFGRTLNVLQLGDDMAEGPGVPVFRTRFVIFLICIGMTGAIVAAAGPIGFVALIAPHMTRYLLRTSDSRQVLLVSALLRAVLLVGADLLAREIFSPAEFPVGLSLTVVGAPAALMLLRRSLNERAAR